MTHPKLAAAEIRERARFRAGLLLQADMNLWEPDDLVAEIGQENVDRMADEILRIARRLMKD